MKLLIKKGYEEAYEDSVVSRPWGFLKILNMKKVIRLKNY